MKWPLLYKDVSFFELVLILAFSVFCSLFFKVFYVPVFLLLILVSASNFGLPAGGVVAGTLVLSRTFLMPPSNYYSVLTGPASLFVYFLELVLLAVFALVSAGIIIRSRQKEKSVRHVALHDYLTGLPNRALLEERTNFILKQAKRRNTKFAVVFLDLDNFKSVNDDFGHETGDLLLKAVAKRLKGCIREEDVVARIGGDEFVVLLPEIKDKADSMNVAEKITNCLKEPIFIKNIRFIVGCSVGISVYPHHGHILKTLFSRADKALYLVKSNGGGGFAFAGK